MRKHCAVSGDQRRHCGWSRTSPPMPLWPLRAFCLPHHWTTRPYSCLVWCGREITMDDDAPFSPLRACAVVTECSTRAGEKGAYRQGNGGCQGDFGGMRAGEAGGGVHVR